MKWCEHCRAHYPEDHYDPDITESGEPGGFHKAGSEYGFFGFLLSCRNYVAYMADEVHDPKAMELMKSE